MDSTNSHGQSPLHIAALFGWDEVAVELIKRGADIDKPIIEEYTYCPPLDGVVYGLPEHLDTVLAIIDQGYSFSRDEVNAFLLICVRYRSTLMLDVIERICHDENGCHRNTVGFLNNYDGHRRNAVRIATFKRSLIKMIKTRDSKDSEEIVLGTTNQAVLKGHVSTALVFGTPLHQATISGHLKTVKILLDEGGSVLAVDNDGRTLLHCAAVEGHVDIIRELLG